MNVPVDSERPITHWTQREIAEEAIKRGIVEYISPRAIGHFLKGSRSTTTSRTWFRLTAKHDEHFEEKCHDICETYRLAPERAKAGIATVSIDEMTGIKALERTAPNLPMRAGYFEYLEFEYIRHGTQTLIGGFNVVTGKVLADIGQTRTEKDFACYLEKLLAQQPTSTQWHLVMDNLNTHCSERLVQLVAQACNYKGALGIKGKRRYS